jgi:hypothetical protein
MLRNFFAKGSCQGFLLKEVAVRVEGAAGWVDGSAPKRPPKEAASLVL